MGRLRRWATPVVTGSFLLVSVTGVLMFFHVAPAPAKIAHEWLGWILVAVALLHVLVNARALGIALRPWGARLALAAFVAITLGVALPLLGGSGDSSPEQRIYGALISAPLDQVAAVAGRSPAELREALRQDGIEVSAGSTSLADVAQASHTHPRRLLALAFQQRGPKPAP